MTLPGHGNSVIDHHDFQTAPRCEECGAPLKGMEKDLCSGCKYDEEKDTL